MKHAIIMCGYPGSGKSSYVELMHKGGNYTHVDFDHYIELMRRIHGTEYRETHDRYRTQANLFYSDRVETTIALGQNIIIDRTNVTVAQRKELINALNRAGYYVEVVFIHATMMQAFTQGSRRAGKHIPLKVYEQISEGYSIPTEDEGMDKLRVITRGDTVH